MMRSIKLNNGVLIPAIGLGTAGLEKDHTLALAYALKYGYRQTIFCGRFSSHQTGRTGSYNYKIIHAFHVIPPVS